MKKKIEVNAIGKTCPIPVIMVKNAIKDLEEGIIEVIVDNEIAFQNIEKMCIEKNLNYNLIKEKNKYVIDIFIEKIKDIKENIFKEEIIAKSSQTTIVIDSDEMGKGDEKLSKTLMKGFIYTLTEMENLPKTIIFYNKGVLLVTEESESSQDIKKLFEMGVEIFTCGACVNFYGLTDKIKIGTITNMYNIIDIQMKSNKIIKP